MSDDGPAIRLLLVEDDDDHARLVERTLQDQLPHSSLTRVADGSDALSHLQAADASDNARLPDLILLDLNLPRVSGLEVLRELKASQSLRVIPVVVMTSSDNESDRATAYGRYANGYVVKPMDFAKFRQMIHDLGHYWGKWNARPAS